MKITHFNNSFILVNEGDDSIICDPWVGKANNGGWQSFPEFSLDALSDKLISAEWVYISHLHSDHFNPIALQLLGLNGKKFIIKKFNNNTLKDRLLKIGITKIYELNPFEIYKFGSFKISILPQMSSNSSDLIDQINYDLDTSIIIKSNGIVFFNQVDNPYSLSDLKNIKDYIDEKYGNINIACLICGAASEYPQNFININKTFEKNKVIERSLKLLIEKIKILTPNYFFQAGGTYIIPGKLSELNDYIAQPEFKDISNIISSEFNNLLPLELEGGRSIKIEKNVENSQIKTELISKQISKEEAIRNHRLDTYKENIETKIVLKNYGEILENARNNWKRNITEHHLKIHQAINIIIYSETILSDGRFDEKYRIKEFKLNDPTPNFHGSLSVHIDQKILYDDLINGRVLSGVLCLFEREPNIFYPTDFFSLNFFRLSKSEIKFIKEDCII